MTQYEEMAFRSHIHSARLKDVEDRMVDIFKKDTDFQDSALVVLEVTYPFPTGHFIQEVIRPREWEIIGVAKTNDDIQEKIFNIKKKKKIFRQALKDFRSDTSGSKQIDPIVIREFFDAT